MSVFDDHSAFDPMRDSKMPVKRGAVWLAVRAIHVLATLGFSRHPGDAWVWARSMVARRRPLSMAIPWLTFDAVREIRAHLPKCPAVFEFGSGHSTLYWANLSARVVSVEDNEKWYEMLRGELAARGCSSVSVVLASSLDDYVGAIRRCPKESQDLVLVDGAYRRNCVEAAIPYVKPGGLLVVDNTDWHWFKDAPLEGIPPSWEKIAYRGFGPMLGHVSETTLWKKPR